MKNKNLQRLWLFALIITPIVLWILPGDFFDDGELVVCLSRSLFDIECLGCGMTRAVMHFHNFQFEDAIFYNTGVLFIYPFLVWLWFSWTKAAAKESGIL